MNDARQKGKTRQQLDHLREALFIGFAIVSVIAVIWGANNLIPGASVASAPTQAVEAQTTGRKALNLQAETGSSEDSTPTQTPTPDNTFYLVQSGDTLDSIAEKLGTSARLLARVNRLVPGQDLQPGQRLFIPRFRGRPYYLVPPTPVLPQTQPDALSPSSSLTDILQRMQQVGVSFNTLWVDARSIAYGPPGYVGPPRVYRAQVWYSSDQALALGGASETQPDEVILRNEGRLYTSDPNSDSPWYSDLNSSNVVGSHLATNLGTIFNAILEKPGNLPAAGLKVAGKDQVAGRSALILDQMDLSGKRVARLWMDDRTGFVLRQQQFGGLDDRTLLKEVWVTRIAFDVNFPSSLFVPQIPWRGGFANDETGQPLPADATPLALPLALGHEPVVAKSAPAGFNPSHSRLTFQFSQNFDPFANSGQVDLFAGSYRLGRLEFGNPENMVCNRSADGERIAFVSTPSELDWPRPDLRWFSLSDLSNIHTPLPGIAVSQFAFAPDSHQLAGFGAGSVFVLDTDTGSIRHLLLVSDAQSFVWSPDGRYLAMVAVRDPVVGNEAIVIRMSTGEAIYHTPMDVRRGSSTPFWPMKDWGVDFPRDMGGLEACAVPPK